MNEGEKPVQDLAHYNEQSAEPIVTSSTCVSHRFSYAYDNVKNHQITLQKVPAQNFEMVLVSPVKVSRSRSPRKKLRIFSRIQKIEMSRIAHLL